ncbi:hypothetical protein OsJ_15139 [Oryza sativa Japonica Group]|uniref:Uncharacterized protein n=2 Tax=Oryza TaxID=4527 RepID=A3AUR3_ORYSJ|nr:uncharacterized protein LOC4336124 isoform X1 [Oryza sativa Japonica Group]EAZ31052.1 hypothetical protein OsJ_15139 [Oryza sativa Japonica Group]
MQEKYVLHTSPRKGCRLRRWRRVRRDLRDNPLDLDVNFLVLATGYSLGIGSGISGVCINRKRIRMKDFGGVGRIARKSHPRGLRDKEEACIFESYFVTSGAGGAVSNNRHQIMSMSYDGDQSEDRQSEEVQSAYKSHGGGVLRGYFNLDRSEEQNEENEWSWIPQDGDPLAESMSSLQTTQEALENEMQKLSDLSKELGADNFSSDNRANNAFVSPDEDDVLETNQKMSHLEQKLEEASNTIREKNSVLSQLQELIDGMHIATPAERAFDIDQLETDLDRQLQEKIEAEIQSLVMLKARQSWQVRTEDQLALKEHKLSSSGGDNGDGDCDSDNARMMMMVKLRETESKIVKLKEQVEKLEVHERELFGTTQVLRMQSRTLKICLFGLLQLVLLFLSLKAFFAQVSDPFDDVVPT